MTLSNGLLLIADDERPAAIAHAQIFKTAGWKVVLAGSHVEARQHLASAVPERALIEQRLADSSGLDLLRDLKQISPLTRVVVLTRFASLSGAVQAVRAGAFNYLSKPAPPTLLMDAFNDAEGAGSSMLSKGRLATLARMEWELINHVLVLFEGNISKTARALGVDRRGLRRKLFRGPTPEPEQM